LGELESQGLLDNKTLTDTAERRDKFVGNCS